MAFNLEQLRQELGRLLPADLCARLGSPQLKDDSLAAAALEGGSAFQEAESLAGGALNVSEGASMTLDILFSDYEWSLTLTNPLTNERVIERRDDRLDAIAAYPDSRAGGVDCLRAAIRSLGPGERGQCRHIRLWPIDAAIEMFDNRAVRSFGADKASLAKLSERLLGDPECGFDSIPYGRLIENESERRLIAACRLNLVRTYLSALGDMAPHLVSIAPASLVWLGRTEQVATRAVLHIGTDASLIIVSDADSGVVVQRRIQTGAHAFAAMVANANSLPLPEAAKEMSARDMVGRAVAGGTAPPLEKLIDVIQETFAYFTESRLADPPLALETAGAFGAINGLEGLLEKAIGIQVEQAAQSGIRLDAAVTPDFNLLRGSDAVLFTDGVQEYRFVEDRFVGAETDERKQTRQKSKPVRGAKDQKAPMKVFGITMPRLVQGESVQLTPANLAACVMLGLGVLGFIAYELGVQPASAALARSSGDYGATQTRITALEGQLETLRTAARQDAFTAEGADKILWAEKFASIADALPPTIWLTGAGIANTDRRVGDVEVVTTKLILVGVTRADSAHRLQDIAAFIRSLEQDQKFMRDFRRIVFAGLGSQTTIGAGSGAVEFEIHAWYDDNKRKATAGNGLNGDSGSALLSSAADTTITRAAIGARLSGEAPDPAVRSINGGGQ